MSSPPERRQKHGTCVLDARIRDRLYASDSTLVILGGRGWMGSATLAMLDAGMDAAFLRERVRVYGSDKADIDLPSGTSIACAPLSALATEPARDIRILHYAYATKDKLATLGRAAFIDANARIQSHVAAAIRAWRPRSLFFPSSGAVYAADGSLAASPDENLYGWMKRCDETGLAALTRASGTRLWIGRVFTMAGAFINKTALYALACFLNDLKAGGPIRIHAAHRVLRSYADVADVINLALACLLDDRSSLPDAPVTYDVAGREVVELGDLAVLCRAVCARPDVPILRPDIDTARVDRMLGNAEAYESMLRSYGLAARPLEEQIRGTAQWLGAC